MPNVDPKVFPLKEGSLYSTIAKDRKSIERAFSLTWPASMLIHENKRTCLHIKKRVQFPQGCVGTPTWPPFHCFGRPIWPSWSHVKTLHKEEKCDVTLPRRHNFWITTIVSLRNDAGDGKENWKKASGLYPQNNNSGRASRLCVRFLVVVAWLRRETSQLPALRSRWARLKNFLFLFLNLDTVLSELTPESFANIWQSELNWITSMKFETVRTHFRSNVFGLLSSRNFVTMATWRNDFSALSIDNLPPIWRG